MQRIPAGGDPRSHGGCSAVTHEAGLTLPRPLSTGKAIDAVAGLLPLLTRRPAHPKILNSHSPIARSPPRLPKGVGPSETAYMTRALIGARSGHRFPHRDPGRGRTWMRYRHQWRAALPDAPGSIGCRSTDTAGETTERLCMESTAVPARAGRSHATSVRARAAAPFSSASFARVALASSSCLAVSASVRRGAGSH